MSERFQVATCEGFRIREDGGPQGAARGHPGISATVCDTLHLWREVKTYRSEERLPVARHGNLFRGRDGALQDALDHAAYLNALYDGG